MFQGRNADALAMYFGEDPAKCPFEQGTDFVLFLGGRVCVFVNNAFSCGTSSTDGLNIGLYNVHIFP